MKKIEFKTSIIYQIMVMIFSIVIIFILNYVGFLKYEQKIFILDWIGLISILISIYIYVRRTQQIISPYIVLYLSFIFFQYGQSILYALKIDYDYSIFGFYSKFWENDLSLVFNGISFTIICILGLNLGCLLSLRETNKKSLKINIENNIYLKFGWIMFSITIIPTIMSLVNEIKYSLLYGYKESLELIPTNFLDNVSIFFVPSCILLILYYIKINSTKMTVIILKCVLVVYAIGIFIAGGRTEALAIITTLILIYFIIENTFINFKKILITCFTAFCLLVLVNSISDYRDESDKTISQFTQIVIDNSLDQNPIVEIIGEMGWSANPLFMTMNIVGKDLDYKMGQSYIAALITAIPSSLDPTGFVTSCYEKASLGRWLTKYINLSFGVDYNLIAESYYNFSYFGIFAIVILGYLFGGLFAYLEEHKMKFTIYQWYIRFALLYAVITVPRRSFSYFVNQYVYIIIFMTIGMLIINKLIKYMERKRIEKNENSNCI